MSQAEEKPAINEAMMAKIMERGGAIIEARIKNSKAIEARYLSGDIGYMRADLLIKAEIAEAQKELLNVMTDELIREIVVQPLLRSLFGGLLVDPNAPTPGKKTA